MCSEGVSVWFACKLCKSYFLNADDFAYHKKKSHVKQFRRTKFIVFEEKTTPPASPPENWISFLSPKEETQVHKIISSPLPSTISNVNCNGSYENLHSNRNEECIKIEPKRTTDLNHRHNKSDDASKKFNNCFELNRDFNSNADTDNLANKQRKKHSSSRIKSTLKITTKHSKISSPKISSVLQTVVQPPHNPYVYLEKLNLRKTVQNISSHSNGTIQSQEIDRNHGNSNAGVASEAKVPHGDQEQFSKSNSPISSPPLATLEACKFCSAHFNSTAKLIVHEEICRLKRQFENILCVPCLLTFDSSEELNAHNQTFHSNSGSASEVTKHRTKIADDPEVGPKTKIKQLGNDDQSRKANLPVSKHYDKNSDNENDDWEEEIIEESSENLGILTTESILPDVFSLSQNQELNIPNKQNVMPGPITGVNLSYAHLLDEVKTEYAHGNEDGEFPGVDRDPLETESAKKTRNKAAASSSNNKIGNHDKKLATQIRSKSSGYCVSCQTYFISIQELTNHFKSHHDMQDGKGNFKCPRPNCGKTVTSQSNLRAHLKQAHSSARPHKCPHPSCKMSFKTVYNRDRHSKQVHLNESNHPPVTKKEGPPKDFSRYCSTCKKSFTSTHRLKKHNQAHHVAQKAKPSLKCPQSKCTYKTSKRDRLSWHLKQVHSNVRPFKCPHPNCKMSFKTTSIRNRHYKCHTKPHVKKVKCDFIL